MATPALHRDAKPHISWEILRPGYFRCKRALRYLRKFQDLIRHRERFALDIDLARPLAELLPTGTVFAENDPRLRFAIDREVKQLMIPVSQ